MIQDGGHVNLGDPVCSFHQEDEEYLSTSPKRRGDRDGILEVGLSDSTLSMGKPCTWGSGQQWHARTKREAGTSTRRFRW